MTTRPMESDRDRWNKRYLEGAYVSRQHPTPLLTQWIDKLPCKNALDIACGIGRNSRFLSQYAEKVIGVDISDVAITQARELASQMANVQFIVADLDNGLPFQQEFDLVLVVRYVNPELLRMLPKFLVPNGAILIEEHLRWDDPNLELAGPKNPDYRVAPGDIAQALSVLQTVHSFEGLVTDPLGEVSAVSQFIGTKC